MENIKTNIRFLLLIASWILIITACQNEKQADQANSSEDFNITANVDSLKKEEPFIKAPCQGIDIPYESTELSSKSGGTITFQSGSRLIIDPNSIVDENGNPVEGSITLLYREIHNPIDFFLSGIPMHYDTANQVKYFESAGMIDVLAFKEGKPVFLKPNASMHMELNSQYKSSDYNVYYLDTLVKNWIYKGKDKIIEKSDVASKADDNKAIKQVTTTNFFPKLADKTKHRFNIDVDLKQFPELSRFKGVMFELSDLNKNFDPSLYQVNWDDAELSKSNVTGNFNLKLYKGDTSFSFIVYPVLNGDNYEKALLAMKDYTKNKSTKNKTEKINNPPAGAKSKNSDEFMPDNKTFNDVKRVFEVNKFGVWNCDKLTDMPHGQEIVGEYADQDNNKLDFLQLVFVDKSKNALFNLNPSKKWSFNPRSQNILWGVLRDNRIAVFSPAQFKKIKKSESTCHFNMMANDNVGALKEIKKFIGL